MADPSAAELCHMQDLYDQGKFLQAYRRAEVIGAPKSWQGRDARILAGRLLATLGHRRASDVLHYLAFRNAPDHAQAFVYAGSAWLHRFGPAITWEFLDRHERNVAISTPQEEADVRCLRAMTAAALRDFVTAESHLAIAEAALPHMPWSYVVRASVRSQQSDHDLALRLGQEALEIRPWYGPAVECVAEQLTYLGRLEEACGFLEEAWKHVESPRLGQTLAVLYREGGRFAAALQALETAWPMTPHPDREMRNWFYSLQSDLLYSLDRYEDSAASLARMEFRATETDARDYFSGFSQRVLGPGFRRNRRQLDVPFIHQEQETCAPTTIAMLAAHWQRPVDHRAVASEICYGGTPGFRQRQWAEGHGWAAREFTLTEGAARQLVDRQVPFAISTVDPEGGHLMAVVGYDEGRQSLLVRDPRQPFIVEYRMVETLQHYAAFGPACLVMLPPEKTAALEGIDLPDSALHDLAHNLNCALDRHDRARAVAALEQLKKEAPGHRITLHAAVLLARYDSDLPGQLRGLDALLDSYPDSLVLKILKLQCLREMELPAVRRKHLEGMSDAKGTHPIVWARLAEELSRDARHRVQCRALLRKSLRARPYEAQSHFVLGGLRWDEGRYAEACQSYRFALCLAEKDERMVHAYFTASRHVKKTDEAVRYLRDRFERFGVQSARPAMSLFAACAMMGRAEEGLAALEENIRIRADDGELLLFAAARMSEYGRLPRARELLKQAEPRSAPKLYLRTAAHVAMCELDLARAAALWRETVQHDPFDAEALTHAARLIGQTESPRAAVEFLEGMAGRFPHNLVLQQLLYDWTPGEQIQKRLGIVETVLGHDPDNVWALHRRALLLLDLQRIPEAMAVAQASQALVPEWAEQHWVMGLVHEAAGRPSEARQACTSSLRARVDFQPGIDLLMRCSPSQTDREESLAIVEQEMTRQTIYGDGLLSYWTYARGVLQPQQLLSSLQRALEARPDLWHAHCAVVRQQLQLQQTEQAEMVAGKAVERFPLVPALWLELARVYLVKGEQDAEVAAIEQALEVNPGWWEAIEMLLRVHDRNNDVEGAEQTAAHAVRCNPLQSEPHVALAEVRLKRGCKEALEDLRQALELDPHNDHAWSCLARWAQQFQQPDAPVEIARRLVERRPGEPATHYRLALLLSGAESLHERLQCLDRAIDLWPRFADAYQRRAELLAENGRFEEARSSLRTGVWGERDPAQLRLCEAKLYLMQGYMGRAVEIAEDVLKTEPRSISAWLTLAQCREASNDAIGYLEAHRMAYDLDPTNVVLAAMLANAYLINNHPQAARQLLEKAVYLSPTYLYAWMCLLDVLLAQGDVPAMEKLVHSVRVHFSREYALSAEIQFAAVRKDGDSAFAAFQRLMSVPNADESVFPPAIGRMFQNSDWARDLESVLIAAMQQEDGHPSAGQWWVRWYAAKTKFSRCLELLDRVSGNVERKRRALIAWCQVYLQLGEPEADHARTIVNRYQEVLSSSTEAWAWAGRALNFALLPGEVVHWMRDWRTMKPTAAWMLRPLAASLFEQGNTRESAEVSRVALRLAPDESVAMHQTLVAWWELHSPDTAAPAGLRLQGLRTDTLWPIHQLVHDCAKCVAESYAATPQQRRAQAKTARQKVDAIWRRWQYPNAPLAQDILAQTRRLLSNALRTAPYRPAASEGQELAPLPMPRRRHRGTSDSVLDRLSDALRSRAGAWAALIFVAVLIMTLLSATFGPRNTPYVPRAPEPPKAIKQAKTQPGPLFPEHEEVPLPPKRSRPGWPDVH
jgi:tetratricopeptide (TPR) repeat protein